MRWGAIVLSGLLAACGLKPLLPEGPVLTAWERSRAFPGREASGAAYEGEAVGAPILPIMAFGVAYETDIVLRSRHPAWDMHEYAVLRTPDGDVWIAKDARAGVLEQVVTVDLDDPEAWLPELPIAKHRGAIDVVDRSHDEWLDVDLSYVNYDGQRVDLSYLGRGPATLETKRNGSTMGHSRDAVYAVLDLSHRDFAKKVALRFDGERMPMVRLFGLVPFQAVLQQTQGGFAVGHYVATPDGDGFVTVHDTYSGGTQALAWTLEPSEGGVDAVQRGDFRTLRYRFRANGDALELAAIEVTQWGRPTPTVAITLEPPLPDLRRRFAGTATSAFVVDVNGQQSHAIGKLTAAWEGDDVVVDLVPIAPWWTLDRPMRSRIRRDGDAVDVRVERVPVQSQR